MSIFVKDMIDYVLNPILFAYKLLKWIIEYKNVTGNKINVENSIAFLSSSNEWFKFEIKY